jgi:hypothetical protein
MFWKKKEKRQYKTFILQGPEAREVKELYDYWLNTRAHSSTACFDLWKRIGELIPESRLLEDLYIEHTALTTIITNRPSKRDSFWF